MGEVHVGQFAFPAARRGDREGRRVGEAAPRLRRDVGRRQVGGDEVAADLVLLKLLQFLVQLPFKLLHERDEFRYVFAELDLDGICRTDVESGKREAWRLRGEDGAEEHVERTHGRVDFASAGRQHGGDLFERPLEDPYRGEYPDDAILAESRRLRAVEIVTQLALYLRAAAFDGDGKRMSAGRAPFGGFPRIVVAAEENLFGKRDGFGERRIGNDAGRLGGGLDGDKEIDVPFADVRLFEQLGKGGEGCIAASRGQSLAMLHGVSI